MRPKIYDGLFTGVLVGYLIAAHWSWQHLAWALLSALIITTLWILLDAALLAIRHLKRQLGRVTQSRP